MMCFFSYSIVPVTLPMAKALILTHIFFGSLVELNEMVEVVIHPAIRLGLIGHFTKSICKMWVRIRAKAEGLLVSTGAVTHLFAQAPLALSTMAPSEPIHAYLRAICFLPHSHHDLQYSHKKDKDAF